METERGLDTSVAENLPSFAPDNRVSTIHVCTSSQPCTSSPAAVLPQQVFHAVAALCSLWRLLGGRSFIRCTRCFCFLILTEHLGKKTLGSFKCIFYFNHNNCHFFLWLVLWWFKWLFQELLFFFSKESPFQMIFAREEGTVAIGGGGVLQQEELCDYEIYECLKTCYLQYYSRLISEMYL